MTPEEKALKKIKAAKRTGADYLDLSNMGLTSLPPEVCGLTNLSRLDLDNNQLSVLPPEVCGLTNLTTLWLNNNQLSVLPPKVCGLTNLTKLWLNNNQLSVLPPEVCGLTNLTELYLSYNQLTSLPPEVCGLTNLSSLDLDNNQLSVLPPEVCGLSNLTRLYLSDNQLSVLPPEVGQLANLTSLDLRSNQLIVLPPEVVQLTKLEYLFLVGNKLPIPPEILNYSHNPSKILNYYFEHIKTEAPKRALNEAKVLFVGQGDVGKTSLIKMLLTGKYDKNENKTEGIDIHKWDVKIKGDKVRLNLWDFGGQEIMHSTHKFFLTKRSVYVLVLDSRRDDRANRLSYWLRLIESFASDSPVIVVCNQCDEDQLNLDWRNLHAKFPNIRHFVKRASCETPEGIDDLKEAIREQAAKLDHLKDVLLESEFAVKDELENMEEPFVSYDDYLEMCKRHGLTNEQSQNTLLEFLHDLGIVLHYSDAPHLEFTNVLKPEWVTEGVYKILNANEFKNTNGVVETDKLSLVLDHKAYPKDKRMFVLEMMVKFELCHEFEGSRHSKFLVPDLLHTEALDTGDWSDALAFQYHYEVLPQSIMTRFIVRMFPYMSDSVCWLKGVMLESEDGRNQALIKSDLDDAKIFIKVRGQEGTRRDLLQIIRAEFRLIHETFSKLRPKEMVPIPDTEAVYPYKSLLKLKENVIDKYYLPEADCIIYPNQLLDIVETPKWREDHKKMNSSESDGSINLKIDINQGDKRMEKYKINNEGGAVNIKGTQNVGSINFVKSVEQSTLSDDLKNAFTAAYQKLKEGGLPEAYQKPVEDDLNTIKTEMEKETPDQGVVKTIWNRIQQVAPSVATALGMAAALKSLLV